MLLQHSTTWAPTCPCWSQTDVTLSSLPSPCAAAAKHDLNTYLSLLGTDGKLVMVGLPEEPVEFGAFSLGASERDSRLCQALSRRQLSLTVSELGRYKLFCGSTWMCSLLGVPAPA